MKAHSKKGYLQTLLVEVNDSSHFGIEHLEQMKHDVVINKKSRY